jgi:hypothetical protein
VRQTTSSWTYLKAESRRDSSGLMPTNVLKIHRKTNHVVDIWGKLKFKQSFTILEKSVPEIQNISRVDLL